MDVYELIMQALSEEDNSIRLPAKFDKVSAAHYLSNAPHITSRNPHLMFAFDKIDNIEGIWRHKLVVELFSVTSIQEMKKIPALLELETELVADLLLKDLGGDYRTPNSWDIADMCLYFPKFALPRIRDLGQQRRTILQGIIDINTPCRVQKATKNDFFCAYSLGNYTPSQLEGIVWNYLADSLNQGMEIEPIDDNGDTINAFYDELVESYEYQDYDLWSDGLTPPEVMKSIVSFYNGFMRYRDLTFVKRKIENLIFDLENYKNLVRYCVTN